LSRVVHIASAARLSLREGQMLVEREGEPPARVPVEDLGVVVLDHAPITMTARLLSALTAQGAAVVVSDAKHLPAGVLLPMAGSSLHARVLRGQIAASLPRTKRLWQAIVRAKVREQAEVLREFTGRDHGLAALAKRVGSGDAGNLEGRAARAYFPALFGQAFLRDPDLPGVNARLNYGYAVLRAAVARAVTGAGLHPALGIHHRNQYDAHALADDLMEPLRPLVDAMVRARLGDEDPGGDMDVAERHALLEVLCATVAWDGKRVPLTVALESYAATFRACLLGEEARLRCPGR
ncbi:MAG TPA: type II CRISPR-associated endonuclease Cas1, partial [Chthonomonadales bacterium]|nr:type II CRISPR-associated endonuclease Cas1 [Chthonomonadales bacterium]